MYDDIIYIAYFTIFHIHLPHNVKFCDISRYIDKKLHHYAFSEKSFLEHFRNLEAIIRFVFINFRRKCMYGDFRSNITKVGVNIAIF